MWLCILEWVLIKSLIEKVVKSEIFLALSMTALIN